VTETVKMSLFMTKHYASLLQMRMAEMRREMTMTGLETMMMTMTYLKMTMASRKKEKR
jgi:hypothetical protein